MAVFYYDGDVQIDKNDPGDLRCCTSVDICPLFDQINCISITYAVSENFDNLDCRCRYNE